MKRLLSSVLALALIVTAASAQQQDFGKHRMKRHHSGMGLQKLNLSDKQKADIKSINADFRNQMAALRKQDDLTVREWKGRQETLRKEHRAKIQSLLTKEQKDQLAKAKEERKARHEQMREKRMDMMKQKLGLSDDQSARIKDLRSDLRERINRIREDQSLAREDKKDEIKDLMKEHREKVKSVLTEEQLQKMKELKKNRQGRRRMV